MFLRHACFVSALLLNGFLFSLFLTSCGSAENTELRSAEGEKYYGGFYKMNETDGIKTLDPVLLSDAPSHHVVHQIADLLVDFDSSLRLQPELAERWEISEDQTTYTYHLRKGVMFHDNPCFSDGKGREMMASDVKYCFDRILDARAASKGADYFRDKVVGAQEYAKATADNNGPIPEGGVAGFKVVGDYTFQIQLVKPFPGFKYYPALGFCYIYPKEAVEKYGKDFFRNLVATGPFVLKNWEADRELIVERNPKYWRKDNNGNQLPFLDGIRFSFIKEQSTMLTEFKKGNLDENYRIPSEYIEAIFEKREPGSNDPWKLKGEYTKFVLHLIPAIATQYYGMLTTDPVFSDRRVRQAFNYAIDRERVIAFVLKGQAIGPANHGLVPPSMPNYPVDMVKGYTFDVGKAKALIAEAGYPNGEGFPAVKLQLNAGGGRNLEIAEAIEDQLKQNIGIDVEMQEVQWAQHTERIDKGEAKFFRLGWIADYPEPENFLNLLWGKNAALPGKLSPINSTRYSNPEFDVLFEQAMSTPDDTERYKLYAQAEQIAVDDAPMLWIYHDLNFRLVQPWVKGYTSNSLDRRDLTGAWFDFTGTEKNTEAN